MPKNCHTILLVRPDSSTEDNYTYCDFKSLKECLETLCYVYEEHLRRHHGSKGSIVYSLEELYEFVESFLELNCLVKDKEGDNYIPHNIDWIKEQLFQMLGDKSEKKL
ncbi:protein enhancer of rudimentary-like [Drosophila willistoni]|uniref:protein enhancer of rudimentary-like n=1 Tax=Drosophila willistoni TaxID=7260 RepID=UPI00017D773A|nr:protein enhancer of rudimentary-like [Drosophila willistoni]